MARFAVFLCPTQVHSKPCGLQPSPRCVLQLFPTPKVPESTNPLIFPILFNRNLKHFINTHRMFQLLSHHNLKISHHRYIQIFVKQNNYASKAVIHFTQHFIEYFCLNVYLKVYEIIWHLRCGFWNNKSITDEIISILQILESELEYRGTPHKFKKAYVIQLGERNYCSAFCLNNRTKPNFISTFWQFRTSLGVYLTL
jgi:hypothetical protein